MNKRKVSLEDFYKWYSLNKEELLNKATVGEKFNDKLKEEFLQEWPLDRILTMSIDEYVIGKGQQNKSLCYALEKGKYKIYFLEFLVAQLQNLVFIGIKKQTNIKIKLIMRFQSWISDFQN